MASTSQALPGSAHAPGPINVNLQNHQSYSTLPAPTSQETVKLSEANKVANALKARKRTKTGCLTCRKRRIKCGEERPTCKNCTKSKRDCEGYIPRVIFKEPTGASGIPMQGPYYSQHGYTGADAASFFGDTSGVSLDGASYPAIAPRPSTNGGLPAYGPMPATGGFWIQGPSYTSPIQAPVNPAYANISAVPTSSYATPHPIDAFVTPNGATNSTSCGPTNSFPSLYTQSGGTINSSNDIPVQATTMTWPYSPVSAVSQIAQPSSVPTQTSFHIVDAIPVQATRHQQYPWHHPSQYPEGSAQPSLYDGHGGNRYLQPIQDATQNSINEQVQAQDALTQVVSLKPEPEDDWFDVDSGDEFAGAKPDISRCDLGLAIARNAQQDNGNIRSMTNLLNDPNVLLAYNPSYAASPLRDAQTARIFCHFITATGPTLHVCERHPSNPAVIFSGRPVPKSQQALWSYTLPMLALHHQALLHAMLATASLHIAKLQQTSPTPSLRHYHYALRRVAKALGNQRKRLEPATLAATLLLGFYEVTTAEHNKWNSHLSGARELIMAIPYARLSRRVEAFRQQKAEEESRRAQGLQPNGFSQPSRRFNEVTTLNDRRLNQDLLSSLMGWDTRHDVIGEVLEDSAPPPEQEQPLSQRDVDEYEIQLDLFWWYAKQDMYQSIISGNRLLLSYERWAQCPPRAAIGRLDAVYGSMDHLYLLLARLADFSGRDLSRKKRAHLDAQKPANATRTSPPSSTLNTPSHPPPMYGMIPDPGPVRLPHGFDQAAHDNIYTAPTPSDSKPLDTAFAEAQKEWNAIADAFDRFHASLGPSYEPLSPEHMTPLSTPFGPAIYYRSYSIACVLCLYFCGRIILTRTQPSMPPAAMAAAGVAAPRTATYANTIGRICAGIQPVSNTAPLNPHHGAALMDVCMGLFHAGIQFRDPAQRGWTITKLRDVARLTGWQTSALIASGCERAWMHFAELGKGPPYERTMNSTARDDRIAGRSRDPRMMAERPKDNNDRRFVGVNAGTRVYWAMGLLSVDEDMKDLNLGG